MKRSRGEDVNGVKGDGETDIAAKIHDSGGGEGERRAKATKKRRRWGVEASPPKTESIANGGAPSAVASATSTSSSSSATAAALKSKIAERLAALKNKRQAAGAVGVGVGAGAATGSISSNVQKRAKTFELNLNEIKPNFDSTSKQPQKDVRPMINPYLAHAEVSIVNTPSQAGATASIPLNQDQATKPQEEEIILDSRIAGGHTAKNRMRSKPLTFVEPGTFVKIAERKREKAALAAKAGFASGRKEGVNVVSTGIDKSVAVSPSLEGKDLAAEELKKPIPLNDYENPSYEYFPVAVEWWDVPFLPSHLRNEIAQREGSTMSKKLGGGKSTGGTSIDVESLTTALVTQQKDPKQLLEEAKVNEGKESPNDMAKVKPKAGRAQSGATHEDSDVNKVNIDDGSNQFRQQCFEAMSLEYSRTYTLVQHPPPIITSSSKKIAPIPTAYLTKDELKRRRKLRRAEKQREQQDLQAAGLIPAPEPRLTLSNFMQILGNQAVTDPSKMEQIALKQIASRQRKHMEMNEERKLTKEQRSEKRYAKYHEDISKTGLHVALFFVKDMSHTYYRAKVDLNAQQNGITGAVLSSKIPEMSVIITEGGPKAIQRFIRLMTHRIDWTGKTLMDGNNETTGGGVDEQDDKIMEQYGTAALEQAGEGTSGFNSSNFCALVWTGEALKRTFNTFVFQTCTTAESARKVLESKGVAHFWDQAMEYCVES